MRLSFRARALAAALLVAPITSGRLGAQTPPPGSDRAGPAFTFQRIVDDVYLATGTGMLTVMSNAVIVINSDDVLIVDSHVSPAGAHALLDELRSVTPKPVSYVVNTHYHSTMRTATRSIPPMSGSSAMSSRTRRWRAVSP